MKIDGGPAFPVATQRESGCEEAGGKLGHQASASTWQFPGMTLRDYFAAHSQAEFVVTGPLSDADIEEIAAQAARVRFAVADAMLRERDR